MSKASAVCRRTLARRLQRKLLERAAGLAKGAFRLRQENRNARATYRRGQKCYWRRTSAKINLTANKSWPTTRKLSRLKRKQVS